jgi:hypothetical protein
MLLLADEGIIDDPANLETDPRRFPIARKDVPAPHRGRRPALRSRIR